MRISMDEIVNAVCLHLAERHEVKPQDVEVELYYEEEQGFSAQVWLQGRNWHLIEANLKECMMRYMLREYEQRVFPEQIRLDVDDEIFAEIV